MNTPSSAAKRTTLNGVPNTPVIRMRVKRDPQMDKKNADILKPTARRVNRSTGVQHKTKRRVCITFSPGSSFGKRDAAVEPGKHFRRVRYAM